jgi:hypothetical protein
MSLHDPFPLQFYEAELHFRSDAGGTGTSFRAIRVLTDACIYVQGAHVTTVNALIDTGATISVFPQSEWKWIADWIRWLEPSSELATEATWVKGVADDSQVPARIGLIDISLLYAGNDESATMIESPRFTIVGKFMEAKSSFNRVVLGMQALEHWSTLQVDFNSSSACLLRDRHLA